MPRNSVPTGRSEDAGGNRNLRNETETGQKPPLYPPNTLLTARIGYLAQSQCWCADFTREVFRLHWTQGVIIGTDDNIRRSLNCVGQDADRIIAMAQSDENKTGLRQQTEQAKVLGIFGSPTFIVRNELFWGDDRLEDALDFSVCNS